jgi:hypothetical protein
MPARLALCRISRLFSSKPTLAQAVLLEEPNDALWRDAIGS